MWAAYWRTWGSRLMIGLLVVVAASFTEPRPSTFPRSNIEHGPAPTRCDVVSNASFIAAGDIMLSRGVDRAISRARDPNMPFTQLAEYLGRTDLNFANLESPVSGHDERIGKGLVFNTHRDDVEGLVKHNFRIVSLANNHALDQGESGLRFTQQFLADLGIEQIGTGNSQAEAWSPKIIAANGVRIAFIAAAYSSINDGGQRRNRFVARIDDTAELRAAIRRARLAADLVVVAMHAGVEYTRRPHRTQIAFARAAIDAGADIVIGSHPHWIQTIEEYRGKYIFYSLGNFIFDQRQPGTREGLLIRIGVGTEKCSDKIYTFIKSLEIIPIIIERVGVPRRASEAETAAILKKIGVVSTYLIQRASSEQ